MIEMIPSKNAREALLGKRVFTDSEKATLIWNSPITTRKEKLDSLEEMAGTTSDVRLKRQIEERLEYEKKSFKKFTDNQDFQCVFVVFDEERDASGYLAEYELARQFGIKICKEYEMKRFSIEKQHLFGGKTKSKEAQTTGLEENRAEAGVISVSEYEGRESAWACFNSMGEIKDFYSNEESDRAYVNSSDTSRFENQFFEIPAVIGAGVVVKLIGKDTYAVTGGSMSCWDEYMKEFSTNSLKYDFSDIQTPVYQLYEDGTLAHTHINPIYLEPMIEAVDNGDEKVKAYFEALFAVGEYLKELTEDKNEKALGACRKYADICAQDNRRAFKAKSVEDLFG